MAENKEDPYTQVPLIEGSHKPEDIVVPKTPLSSSSSTDRVLSQKPSAPSEEPERPKFTEKDKNELARLREELSIHQDQGLDVTDDLNRISELAAKEAGGYSLTQKRFAPGSMFVEGIEPIGITPDGRPVFPYINSLLGKGVLMELPKSLEEQARYNQVLANKIASYDNLIKIERPKSKGK